MIQKNEAPNLNSQLQRAHYRLSARHLFKAFNAALISIAFIFSSTLHAQMSRIEPSDESGLMCIDTPPVGDGLGWNGECECTTTPYYHFGEAIKSFKNTLLIGAWDTAHGCTRSGVASVYRIGEGSEPPTKVADLKSDPNSNLFANNSDSMEINDRFIAIGGGFNSSAVSIYNRDDLTLHTTLIKPEGPHSNFGRTIKFTSDQIIVGDTKNTYVYNLSDWALDQTIDSPSAVMAANENYIVVNLGAIIKVYEKDSLGNYQPAISQHVEWTANWSFDLKDDTVVISYGDIETVYDGDYGSHYDVMTGGRLVTLRKNVSGEWTKTENAGLPKLSHVYPVKLLDGQLIYYNASGISFMESNAGGWVEAQFLALDSKFGEPRLHYSNDEIIAVYNYAAVDKAGTFQVDVLSKQDSGQWEITRSIENLTGTPTFGVVGGNKIYLPTLERDVLQIEAQLSSDAEPCNAESVFCDPILVAPANPGMQPISTSETSNTSNGGGTMSPSFLLMFVALPGLFRKRSRH